MRYHFLDLTFEKLVLLVPRQSLGTRYTVILRKNETIK
jgi:hypothetical protein